MTSPKHFVSIERRIRWTILYEKGIPWRYIRSLQQGQTGTRLRPKFGEQLGGNNKGSSQGIPLSAQLFAIYFDAMLQEYDNALPVRIKQSKQETCERNEFEERRVTTNLWRRHSNASKNTDRNHSNYMGKAKRR